VCESSSYGLGDEDVRITTRNVARVQINNAVRCFGVTSRFGPIWRGDDTVGSDLRATPSDLTDVARS
jgi:hypothetical protein